MNLEEYLREQSEFSLKTFGPSCRTRGIIQHIQKELDEINLDPHDLSEWIDVIILALDGYWRHGGNPRHIMTHLIAKLEKNKARTWPDFRSLSEDVAIEHDRRDKNEGTNS